MIKKILLGLLAFIIIAVAGVYLYYRLFIYQTPAISDKDRASVELIPLPASLELKSGKFKIDSTFEIGFEGFKDERLEKASDRFLKRLSSRAGIDFSSNGEPELLINCSGDSPNKVQQVVEDETYILKVSREEIVLWSNGPYGTLRGLETLLQLLIVDTSGSYFPAVVISDQPRFPWRGIMIDVCRHWMPMEVILRNLDAMAAVKMNVLHLHLSEDQGFRVESKLFPKLHEIGSNGKYYTQQEIREIIAYAYDRGIRIIPEFDLPGHSKSWQIAYPELSTVDYPLKFGQNRETLFQPPLDPTKEIVYDFLDRFFGEMAGLFPDPCLHIGGDEVNPTPWNNEPHIQQYMKENGLKDAHDLQAYFNKRMNEIIRKHGKTMIGWEEILNENLGENVTIQSWKNQKSLFQAVKNGNNGILSTGLYLDHKLHAEKHYGVDPLILPGAVDIVPDSSNWKMFDVKIEIPGNTMDGQMILFDRDPRNSYGYFAFLDERNAFRNAAIIEGNIRFELNAPVGELDFTAHIDEDSLNGNLSFGFMKFPVQGYRTGGSDIEGSSMPKIEIMKPLTEEEKQRILGGEAAMWSELVSYESIDSRLWPRSAAIAEKLWTPADLTIDIDDMYRRLGAVSRLLSKEGSLHLVNYEKMLHALVSEDAFQPLKNFVDILEEMKYYARMVFLMQMDEIYLPDVPLDHVADIARPESPEARSFNKLVDRYVDTPDENLKKEISDNLDQWAEIHDQLLPFFAGNERLLEIDSLSNTLSIVSKRIKGLEAGGKLTENEMQEILRELDYLENGENGVLVAVAPGLRKLVMHSLQ